jgi:hypothetical protein
MSQLQPPTPPYPSDVQPGAYPPYYAAQHAYPSLIQALAPARRSAVLQWVLGGLFFLFGGCLGGFGAAVPKMRKQPELEPIFRQLEAQSISPSAYLIAAGVVIGAVALGYIVLGFFTRRGGLGAIVTSIVLTSLVALYLGLSSVAALFMQGGPAGACMVAPVLALHVLLLVWLIQAARASAIVRAMRFAPSVGYWPQQAPVYGYDPYAYGVPAPRGGYGYATSQPNEPPGAPAPPDDAPPQPPASDERSTG